MFALCSKTDKQKLFREIEIQEKDEDDRKGRGERRKKSLIVFTMMVEPLPIVLVSVDCALKDKVLKPNYILRETWVSS